MRSLVLAATILVLWLANQRVQTTALAERATWPTVASHVVLPPAQLAPILAAGYRQLWADLTWVRALVYFGGEAEGTDHHRELEKYIDNILALDPGFRRAYEWAGYVVTYRQGTATQEEFRTSVRYLERGIEHFPHDWQLLWLAGQRYYFDLDGDTPEEERRFRERGAEFIERAMRVPGAPAHIATAAAGMRSRLGQHERALQQLQEMILTTDNPQAQERLLQRFRSMSADIPGLVEELEAARQAFDEAWRTALPYAPASLYVIVGDPPAAAFDLEALAAPRDLFGIDSDPDSDSDPDPDSDPELGPGGAN